MQTTFVRHQGRNSYFYLLGCKEWKRYLKCQMGTGHCPPGVRRTCGEDRGEGGREIYSQFLKTLLNTFSPTFAEPKTPLGPPSHPKSRKWAPWSTLSLLPASLISLDTSCITATSPMWIKVRPSCVRASSFTSHNTLFSGKETSVKASKELPSLAVT